MNMLFNSSSEVKNAYLMTKQALWCQSVILGTEFSYPTLTLMMIFFYIPNQHIARGIKFYSCIIWRRVWE